MTKVIKTTPKKAYEKLSPKMNTEQKEGFKDVLKGSKEVHIYLNNVKDKIENKDFSPIERLSNGITLVCKYPAYKGQFVEFEGEKYYIAKDNEDLKKFIYSNSNLRKNRLPLNNIITSFVTDMGNLFYNWYSFNESIEKWDMSNVKFAPGMFALCVNFNQPLNNWDTSSFKDINGMFFGATSFNQPLDKWNMSNCITLRDVFAGAKSFNQPLNNWDISNVTNLVSTFHGCKKFNQPLDKWNTSKVLYFDNTFEDCKSFNQNISNWKLDNFKGVEEFDKNANKEWKDEFKPKFPEEK